MKFFKKKSGVLHKNPIRKYLQKGVEDVFFLVEGAEDATAEEVRESAIDLLTGTKKIIKIPRRSKKDIRRAVDKIDVDAYNEWIRSEGLEVARKARETITK